MNTINYLQIEPTTRCNFRCSFCCRKKLQQKDMNIHLFSRMINEMPPIRHIHLQGEGEPLLHSHIVELFQFARKKADILTTITNGSLLEQHYKELVESGIDRIGISIESTDSDDFRRIRGGDLHTIISGIRHILQYRNYLKLDKPAIGFEVTLLKDNIGELRKISELYRELEMDGGISVQPLNTTPFYYDNYDNYLRNQVLDNYDSWYLAKEVEKINRSILINEQVDKMLPLRQSVMKENECPLLNSGLFVHATGKVTFCCLMKAGEDAFLGDINHEKVSDILVERGRRLQQYQEHRVWPQECRNCVKTEMNEDIV